MIFLDTICRRFAFFSGRLGVMAFIGLFSLCVCGAVQAQQSPTPKAPNPTIRIIIMMVGSDPTETTPVEQTIISQLADLHVDVDFYHTRHPVEGQQQKDIALRLLTVNHAAAVFVISPNKDHFLRIFIHQGNEVKSAARDVDVSNGMPHHEAVAVIVRATTNMLIDQAAAASKSTALSPQPVESPISTQAIRPPEDTQSNEHDTNKRNGTNRFHAGMGLALTKFSGDYPISPGLHVHLGWQPAAHFRMTIAGTFLSRESFRESDVSITLHHHPVYAGIGYVYSLRKLTIEGGAALGLDVVSEEFHSNSDTFNVNPEQTELQPLLLLYMQSDIEITRLWRIYVRLGGAVSFRKTTYAVDTGEENLFLAESLPFQPTVFMGVLFHFF